MTVMAKDYFNYGQTLLTSWLVIVTQGETVDGRDMTEQKLKDMAETYSRAYYEGVINFEHWDSYLGYIAEVKYCEHPELEGKFCLMARLTPNSDFLYYTERGFGNYLSIEWVDDFQGTGKTYLVGLALLESYPGSIGTSKVNILSARIFQGNIQNKDVRIGPAEKVGILGLDKQKHLPLFERSGALSAGAQTSNPEPTPVTTEIDMTKEELKAEFDKRDQTLAASFKGILQAYDQEKKDQAAKEAEENEKDEEIQTLKTNAEAQDKKINKLSSALVKYLGKEALGQEGDDVTGALDLDNDDDFYSDF
jgi:hypothetical protein